MKISHRADIYSKTRSPFLLLSLFVYSLVACTKFLEFVHIYIYIWIYERRTKVNRSVGASTEKCKRAGGFAQKTVFFMYRVSLKWFALGVYIILWWSVIAGQMDLFTLRLHYWTFSNLSLPMCLLISEFFCLTTVSDYRFEVEWTRIRILIDLILKSKVSTAKVVFLFPYKIYKLQDHLLYEMKRSWNFFDRNFFVKRIFRANLFVFV